MFSLARNACMVHENILALKFEYCCTSSPLYHFTNASLGWWGFYLHASDDMVVKCGRGESYTDHFYLFSSVSVTS